MAARWLVLESLRSEEFSPVKNAEGLDSPATAKRDLSNLAAKWLEGAGVVVPRDEKGDAAVPLEISPKLALDRVELASRLTPGKAIAGPTYLE